MTILSNMPVLKELSRATTIRKFPNSLRERIWKIKTETNNQVFLETIIIEAIKLGLPKIEHRVLFRIPDFVEEPKEDRDDLCG